MLSESHLGLLSDLAEIGLGLLIPLGVTVVLGGALILIGWAWERVQTVRRRRQLERRAARRRMRERRGGQRGR
ncbi:MAG: hypothetical protein CMD39_07370 [Gammaproteobacteria bacterium]|nr:hypothetical protein [Gammaproteobacteria bacterium]